MAKGDLGPIISTLEFDTTEAINPVAVHVAGDVYAVVSRTAAGEGYIRTVNVPCASPPGITLIDTWNYSHIVSAFVEVTLFQAHPTWFLICFYDGSNSYVKSFQIAADGTITPAFTDSLTITPGIVRWPDFVWVSGVNFICALMGAVTTGYFYSFSCSAGGALTFIQITAVTTAISFEWSRVLKLIPNYFVMTFEASNQALVATAHVSDLGVVTAVDLQSVKGPHVGFPGKVPCVKVSSTIIAIAYGGESSDGFIQTVEINATGTIITALVDIYEFDTTEAQVMDIISVEQNYFVVLYIDASGHGQLKSFYIDDAGAITTPFLSTFEIEDTVLSSGRLAPFESTCLLPAYQGVGGDGFIKSVDIELAATGGPHHEMIMKVGP